MVEGDILTYIHTLESRDGRGGILTYIHTLESRDGRGGHTHTH